MQIKVKIKSEHLNGLLDGTKIVEYRQIESMTLVDENGREVEFQVESIKVPVCSLHVRDVLYPDIDWDSDLPIFVFHLELLVK